MKYLLSILALIIVPIGCTTRSAHLENDNIISYNIDYKSDAAYFWDEYFEYSHHVVLETNDESLFKEISKLIIRDNRIYILCSSMNKIITFDMTGKFIKSLCRHGEGPEEYLSAVDINVNSNNTIEVLDKVLSKINTYTLTGEFIGTKKCISAAAFLRVDKDCYIFNRNNLREQIEEPQPFNFFMYKRRFYIHKRASLHSIDDRASF